MSDARRHVSARSPLAALAVLAVAVLACAPAGAQITVYEHDAFQGRNFTSDRPVLDLQRSGFNDRASSVVVAGQRWEICENSAFGGRCRVLRPGQYASLTAMGMNDRVSSVRAVARNSRMDSDRYGPEPVVATDYRRRRNERLFEARVTGSRAVYGVPEQRCWIERENLAGRDNRLPGALVGAVIGGILGHQIGGNGRHRELATLGGVVGGAVVGANVGGRRGDRQREVQRCANMPGPGAPAFWDVSYVHRGQQHHVQLAEPPGPTVTVNRAGEPRA
jgi:Beta/Gamma crystallin/Glycine zipper 2TM domain